MASPFENLSIPTDGMDNISVASTASSESGSPWASPLAHSASMFSDSPSSPTGEGSPVPGSPSIRVTPDMGDASQCPPTLKKKARRSADIEYEFVCPEPSCDRKYAYKNSLVAHVRKAHNLDLSKKARKARPLIQTVLESASIERTPMNESAKIVKPKVDCEALLDAFEYSVSIPTEDLVDSGRSSPPTTPSIAPVPKSVARRSSTPPSLTSVAAQRALGVSPTIKKSKGRLGGLSCLPTSELESLVYAANVQMLENVLAVPDLRSAYMNHLSSLLVAHQAGRVQLPPTTGTSALVPSTVPGGLDDIEALTSSQNGLSDFGNSGLGFDPFSLPASYVNFSTLESVYPTGVVFEPP